ncbi:MAG: hypothetical protein ACRDQZ_18620, partial [Mycobacteriales bacterium]
MFTEPTEQLVLTSRPDEADHRQPAAAGTLLPFGQLAPAGAAPIEFPRPITETRALIQLPDQLDQLSG